MEIKKRSMILSLGFILLMLSTLLAGCGQKQATPTAANDQKAATNTEKTYTVGVTMESLEDFLSYVADGLNQFSKDHPNVKVVILDAKHDSAQQLKQAESFINQKVDAIIIKPVDANSTQAISNECKAAGIPLIAVNANINSPATSYVGSNHKLSGTLETEYMAKLMNGKGNVAILEGDPSQEAAQQRTEATKEVIAKYPGMKIVATQTGMWGRDKAVTIAENWIQSGQKIDAIIANNDEMAIGAEMAYEQAGKKGVLFAGIDGTQAGLTLLKQGKLAVTVFQNGYQQGYTAADTAHKVITGEKVPSYVDVPYELVAPEKADEYLAKYNKK